MDVDARRRISEAGAWQQDYWINWDEEALSHGFFLCTMNFLLLLFALTLIYISDIVYRVTIDGRQFKIEQLKAEAARKRVEEEQKQMKIMAEAARKRAEEEQKQMEIMAEAEKLRKLQSEKSLLDPDVTVSHMSGDSHIVPDALQQTTSGISGQPVLFGHQGMMLNGMVLDGQTVSGMPQSYIDRLQDGEYDPKVMGNLILGQDGAIRAAGNGPSKANRSTEPVTRPFNMNEMLKYARKAETDDTTVEAFDPAKPKGKQKPRIVNRKFLVVDGAIETEAKVEHYWLQQKAKFAGKTGDQTGGLVEGSTDALPKSHNEWHDWLLEKVGADNVNVKMGTTLPVDSQPPTEWRDWLDEDDSTQLVADDLNQVEVKTKTNTPQSKSASDHM